MDCNGNMQHLFADLDAGNVVILEFFMQSCGSCITAGTKLEQMKASLLTQYPGKIKSYATGYNNTYTCQSNKNWVTNNGFTSTPMDSGASQVAYYGGFGMPTIVIVGGVDHAVLGSPYIGFSTSDITTMTTDIQNFFATTGIEANSAFSQFSVFPNPAKDLVNVSFDLNAAGNVVVNLIDLTGKTVSSVSTKADAGAFNQSIDTQSLANGLYILNVTANGNSANTKFNITH